MNKKLIRKKFIHSDFSEIREAVWNKKLQIYLYGEEITFLTDSKLYYGFNNNGNCGYFVYENYNSNIFYLSFHPYLTNYDKLDSELHNLYLKIGDYKKVLEYLSL